MIVEMSRGRQVTIPASIRSKFELDAGTRLEIEIRKNEIVLKPIQDDIQQLFHNAKNVVPKHKLTAEQMDEFNERLFR